MMRQLRQNNNLKSEKTTTGDQQKRYLLFNKLKSHSTQQFRQINIDEFDLNITETCEDLQQIDSSVTPLIYAAYFGLKDITKILLKNRCVDVDFETENNKQTPLITACIMGNYEIVRLLLIAKAQVNKPNLLNHSPLTVILFRLVEQPNSFQNKKICFLISDLLIKYGADVNWIIDKQNGFSLLHYFCSLKMKMNKSQKQLNYQIIKYLLKNGADYKQITLQDKSCEQLLQNHCNRVDILHLIGQYKQKQMSLTVNKMNTYKKIDENYFRI